MSEQARTEQSDSPFFREGAPPPDLIDDLPHSTSLDAKPEPSNIHRVVLTFDGGYPRADLICPKSGCVGSDQCGHCGADLTDPDSERCYDCRGDGPHECWAKTWFDNCTPDELLAGKVEVEILPIWDCDHMQGQIIGARMPKDARI